jgi:hypothetical protein
MKAIYPFLVYLIAAIGVSYTVLRISVLKRPNKPYLMLIITAVSVTTAGMIFARVTYGQQLPWWIFYGIPVLFTFLAPPVLLRMSRMEFLFYTPMALMGGPVIHIFFSFFLGWHEYMPLFYIPSLSDLIK